MLFPCPAGKALPTSLSHCPATHILSTVGLPTAPAAWESWGTRGVQWGTYLPLCQLDFKAPVQHHFKPGLTATGPICAPCINLKGEQSLRMSKTLTTADNSLQEQFLPKCLSPQRGFSLVLSGIPDLGVTSHRLVSCLQSLCVHLSALPQQSLPHS